MRLFLLLSGIVAILFTAGCAGKYVGQGPVKMSYKSAQLFERFAKDKGREDFMLTEDGQSSYYYRCRDNHNCVNTNKGKMIRRCNKVRNATTCRFFANKYEILWKGVDNFMPFKSEAVKKVYGDYFYSP